MFLKDRTDERKRGVIFSCPVVLIRPCRLISKIKRTASSGGSEITDKKPASLSVHSIRVGKLGA
jgi:hypothetical protein